MSSAGRMLFQFLVVLVIIMFFVIDIAWEYSAKADLIHSSMPDIDYIMHL